MPFVCPECSSGCLQITSRIEVDGDRWWDDIAVQIVECSACYFLGAAVYKEERRGALDSETTDHTGCYIREDRIRILLEWIEQCPARSNARCGCPAHRSLNGTDAEGKWRGLEAEWAVQETFPMVWIE